MRRFALVALIGLPLAALPPPAAAGDGATVRVTETPEVSQPGPFSRTGQTVVVPRTRIEIDAGGGGPAVLPAAPGGATFAGKVGAIVDGGTLTVGGARVRLWGLDAPAAGETCTAAGRRWPCGEAAAFALAYETAEHWLQCAEKGRAEDGAVLAVCLMGTYDVGALMVRKGWARAAAHAAPGYADAEAEARAAGVGIWRREPIAPRP